MASLLFRPKLLDTLKGYHARDFTADLTAGLTVGVVALPLAKAFAIASGVKPEAGIFTAVIAGLLISALGGTRVCIGGPTGAFIVILYGIGAKYGIENVCPHVEAALTRARRILGLPPAPPSDPFTEERGKLETAREELAAALERVNGVLQRPAASNPELSRISAAASVTNGNGHNGRR
jgi:hypothetical protein